MDSFIIVIIFGAVVSSVALQTSRISNKRLCADPECKTPISKAIAVVQYSGDHELLVNTKRGDTVTVYSKNAGIVESLWGIENRGKRGYHPKSLLKEITVLNSSPKYEVPTELETMKTINSHLEESSGSSTIFGVSAELLHKNGLQPDSVKSMEIVDGTALYPEDERIEEIEPTVTINNVKPTVDQVKSLADNVDIKENINVHGGNSNSENAFKFNIINEENDIKEIKDLLENQGIDIQKHKLELPSADKEHSVDVSTEKESSVSEVTAENLEKLNIENNNETLNINGIQNEPQLQSSERREFVDGADGVKFDSEENREDKTDESSHADKSLSVTNEKIDSTENVIFSDNVNNILKLNTTNLSLSTESNNAGHKSKTNFDEKSKIHTDSYFSNAISNEVSDSTGAQLVTNEPNAVDDVKSDQTENTEHPVDTVVDVNENNFFMGAPVEKITDEKQKVELVDSGNESFETTVRPDEIGSGDQNFTETIDNNESNLDSSHSQSMERHSVNEIPHITFVETESEDLPYQSQSSDNTAITEMPITETQHVENEEEINSGQDPEAHKKNTLINILEVETKALPEYSLFASLTGTLFSAFQQVYNIFSDVNKDIHLNIKTEEECSVNIANIPNGKKESNISPKNQEDAIELNYGADLDVCKIGTDCSKESSEPNLISDGLHISFRDVNNADGLTDFPVLSIDTLYVLVVTAVTVLCFILGFYYLEKRQHDMFFITKMNKLEKSLLYYKNEAASIKEELKRKEDTLSTIESTSSDSDKTIIKLQLELETFKEKNAELEEQVSSLEKELETATETGLELNRMLSDFLSSQHGSENLVKSVEHLQKQLDSQQNTISEMNTNINSKNRENESLQGEIKVANEKIIGLQDELDKVTDTLILVQKEKLDIQTNLKEKNCALHSQLIEVSQKHQQEISQHMIQIADAQTALEEARETVAMRDSELTVLQDCLKELKAFEDGQGSERLNALLDVGHARAELMIVTLERDGLKDRVKDEEDARKLLEDHVKVIQEEVSNLHLRYDEAEREKREAETKLEVLSNYFKEKETQLQKELGLQEAMCIQKDGDVCSTVEKIKSLQEEIQNYKSQNEILKKEIVDQERSLKGQISTLEKKAHENWIAVRQAERKLEESRQESGTLRNRLTVVEKNLNNTSQNELDVTRVSDRLTAAESNGELPNSLLHLGISELPDSPLHYHQHRDGHPVSPSLIPGQPLPPPFMGIPPPLFIPPPPIPGVPFIPPPPPPLFPGDRRPPPLGRMSSPPPTRHYSPEPLASYSPYDHTSPENFTDDPPPGRFRHITTPPPHLDSYAPRQPPLWDEPRSDFRPMQISHRDSPHESKGSALSSAHSSESLEKSSRHSGRV